MPYWNEGAVLPVSKDSWGVIFMTETGECLCSLKDGRFPVNGIPIRLERYNPDGSIDILEMQKRRKPSRCKDTINGLS